VTTLVVIDSDLEGYTLIEQTDDNGTVSHSWAREAIPIQARLNPDAPAASEGRTGHPAQLYTWGMPSAKTWALMGLDEADRQTFRDAMIAQGRDVSEEV
jgi:hypothetical protein